MKLLLETQGYKAVEASDDFEVIGLVEKEPPDIILMDVSFRGMEGLEVTQRKKKLSKAEHIPIICVTAHSSEIEQRAIVFGCHEVVAKRIDVEGFHQVIARYLKNE